MIVTIKLQQFLVKQDANKALIDIIPSLEQHLPEGVEFDMDVWNLLSWQTRIGNAKCFNIYFDKIKNQELKDLIKIYLLEKRHKKNVTAGTIKNHLYALNFLGLALCTRSIEKLSNVIFYDAQELIEHKFEETTASRYADFLEGFGR